MATFRLMRQGKIKPKSEVCLREPGEKNDDYVDTAGIRDSSKRYENRVCGAACRLRIKDERMLDKREVVLVRKKNELEEVDVEFLSSDGPIRMMLYSYV